MTQKDKELSFKDLSARLPHHVRVKVWLKDGTTEEGLLDLEHNYGNVLQDAFYYNKIKDIKPYLRPMSSMTEKEKEELKKLCEEDLSEFAGFIRNGHGLSHDGLYMFDKLRQLEFCLSHHLDFRGMIKKGRALEAPEEMYNIK